MQPFQLLDAVIELDSDESPIIRRRVQPLRLESRALLILRYVRLN